MPGHRHPAQPRTGIGRFTLLAMLAAILLLAAALRLWRSGAASFSYDPAAISNLAASFVDRGQWPFQGMVSSTGVSNPALGVLLLSLPVFFSRDPVVLAGFVALLNVAGVYGTFWLGRRYWSYGVGLLAALLFAVSPWAVQHSREILGQDMLIPGVVLLLVFLFAWLVDGKQWALAVALVTLAALTQIHYAALALVPVVAILLVWHIVHHLRRHEPVPCWRYLAIGAGIAILLYVPYLVADAQSGWANLGRLFILTQRPYRLYPQAPDLLLMAIGGRNMHSLIGPMAYRQFLQQLFDPAYRLDRLEELLFVVASLHLLVRTVRNREGERLLRRDALLLLWIAGPLVFFLLSKSEVHAHYFVVVYSAPYLAMAAAASDGLAALRGRWRLRPGILALGGALLAVLVAWQAYLLVSIYDFADLNDTPDGWGTPVRILRDVAHTAGQLSALTASSDVLMLCAGSEPRWDECPAAFSFLTSRGPSVAFIDYNDPSFRTHQDDAETLVVLAPGDSLAAGELPHLARELPAAAVPLRQNRDAYRFFEIRNPYREIASYIDAASGPTDAVVLVGSGQREELARYYQGNLPVYELPLQGADENQMAQQLIELTRQHRRLYGLYRSPEESDPQGVISGWLDRHTHASADQWLGPVRLVTYIVPEAGDDARAREPSTDFGGQIELRQVAWQPTEAEAGDVLALRLEWKALNQPGADFVLFAQLLDGEGQLRAQRDVPLVDDGRPASAWEPGQEASTLLGLMIPPGTPPADYRLVVGLYNPADGVRLMTSGHDVLDLGSVKVRRSTMPAAAAALGMRFRPDLAFAEVKLIGQDYYRSGFAHAPDSPLRPGDTLRLVSLWQSRVQPSADWTATFRLVGPYGRTVTSTTTPLAGGQYPASQWAADEIVRGEYDLVLPSTLTPGRYQLQLAVHRGDGRWSDEWSDLGPVAVE
jgi:hypothetical protein